jgi:hypothetical protein
VAHLGVRHAEELLEPVRLGEINLLPLVAVAEIADDLSLAGVLSADRGLAANEPTFLLVEIRGAPHVGRNLRVVAANAVDLHGQEHRDAALVQLPRQLHHRRSAKAVTVENQPHAAPLRIIERPVAVAVKRVLDQLHRQAPLAILEGLHVNPGQLFRT